MPNYKYNALNMNGKKHFGFQYAPDAAELKRRISDKNMFLLDYSDVKSASSSMRKLSNTVLSRLCREMSSMLESGITVSHAVSILLNNELKTKTRNVLSSLKSEINIGNSLSEAMRMQNGAFPELLISMVYVGEESGALAGVFARMADYYESKHKFDSEIRSALVYPIMLIIVLIASVIVILAYILPKFMNIFKNIELPKATKFIFSLSNVITGYIPVIIIFFIALTAILIFLSQTGPFRYIIDKIALKLPITGKYSRKICTFRFIEAFCILYTNGSSMINSIGASQAAIGNTCIIRQLNMCIQRLSTGTTLAEALRLAPQLDSKLVAAVAVGEETGKLEPVLDSLAKSYKYEATQSVKKMLTLIEPLLICILGLFVAFVIISVMQPIYMLYSELY